MLWVGTLIVTVVIVFAPYANFDHSPEWGKAENISYGVLFRLGWSLAVCWVIYACHFGYGCK